MDMYFKVQKINRVKFEEEGPAMIAHSKDEAMEKAKSFTNKEYGYSITKVTEECCEFEV